MNSKCPSASVLQCEMHVGAPASPTSDVVSTDAVFTQRADAPQGSDGKCEEDRRRAARRGLPGICAS